ncbi:MAG: class I SAM-dependent methyltransferase [Candidatus Levybacteria bacterium]|nr:class I SAM-dependent methyltransferase [Candidatus Levybacteria bacterium]
MKNIYQEKTEKFFDKYVSAKKDLDLLKMSRAGRIEFEKFFNFLNLPKGSNVIELGSGYGRFVLQLLKRGYKVTAVDISQESLNVLLDQAKKNNIDKDLKLVRSDFSKPQFTDSYDGAYCISTFHLLAGTEEKRIETFSNLIKSVKKGGTVVVIEPNPLNPFYYPFYWFSDQVAWEIEKTFMQSTEFNLRNIFKKLGLVDVEISYMGFLPNRFINSIEAIKYLNGFINSVPLLNKFSSFIYIKGKKK